MRTRDIAIKWLAPFLALAILPSSAAARQSLTRTRRLVYWINDRFDWSVTDYQRRTPMRVIARRAGNGGELASVLR